MSSPSQTRLATQLTEEEQIRIAQRIGLIQHLPKGVYDPGRDGSEKNNPIKKMGERSKQAFLQRRHRVGQKAREKTFNITNY